MSTSTAFECFITDQADRDLAGLQTRHRAHAIVEDRVRDLNSTGLSNLPCSAFEPNQAWLQAALGRPRFDRLAPTAALRRGARRRRAKATALPAAPRRGAPAPPRPPAHTAPARRLALGRRHRERV